MTLQTDLHSHRIEGIARAAREQGLDGSFDVPLISHVEGNLWQGGCIQDVRLDDDFAFVISLYPWERYRLGPHTIRREYKMYDSADMENADVIREIAYDVAHSCLMGKTLVHCQAGLNRSGLVAGLALIIAGMAPADAIALLRSKRSPVVLCNKTFEQFLLTQS